jgi:hypothetical protein
VKKTRLLIAETIGNPGLEVLDTPRVADIAHARQLPRLSPHVPPLIAGTGAVGSGNAAAAGGSLQARYDTVYAQCMTAKGNRIPPPPPYYWGGY